MSYLNNRTFVFLFIICVIFSNDFLHHRVVASDAKCFDDSYEKLYNHLGTKTPYRIVQNLDDKPITFDGCKPERIWSIIRHGSRNPNRKTIRSFSSVLLPLRDQIIAARSANICENDIELFRHWKPTTKVTEQKYLVAEGTDELIELAERIQNRFPQILSDIYSNITYRFKFTDTQRTRRSFEGFATGLFGRNNIHHIMYDEPMKQDPVLRFYKLCKRWRVEVNKNPETVNEVEKWLKNENILNAVESIKQKTGVDGINEADVYLIYTTCAFETAWYKRKTSPWCTLLTSKSIRAFEFAQDLEYYYVDGYGSELTYKQACPAIKDLIKHIEPLSTEPQATFYFTHSGTMLKLLAHLGLYKDLKRLTADDYSRERMWHVSKIDAFASNLVFVLYNCKNGPNILVLHQERPVRIPGCPQDTDLCPLKLFKTIFADSLERCHFDEMCVLRNNENTDTFGWVYDIASIFFR